MPDEKTEDDELLKQEIIRYLELHPNAADTLQGILKWWLKQQANTISEKVLERNLRALVEQKQIVITISQTGEKIYKQTPRIN